MDNAKTSQDRRERQLAEMDSAPSVSRMLDQTSLRAVDPTLLNPEGGGTYPLNSFQGKSGWPSPKGGGLYPLNLKGGGTYHLNFDIKVSLYIYIVSMVDERYGKLGQIGTQILILGTP